MSEAEKPIPMLLWCPECGERHIDVGEFATKSHHTHSCQSCGMTWRPAVVPTVGVQFLPGFKNKETELADITPDKFRKMHNALKWYLDKVQDMAEIIGADKEDNSNVYSVCTRELCADAGDRAMQALTGK